MRREKNHLYFSTVPGYVYCVDSEKAQVIWTYQVPVSLKSPTYLGKENLYFVGSSNTLYCIDRQGQFVWKKKFDQTITSPLTVDSRKVYLGTEKGQFFALKGKDGRVLWKYRAGGALRTQSVVTTDKVIFGCDNGSLYFLSLNGKFLGKDELKEKTAPTLKKEDEILYFGTEGEHIYSYHLKKRRVRWEVELGSPSYTPPVIKGKRLFFLCWNGVLYCLNKNSGSILWWNTVPARSHYRLEVVEDKIVVTSLSSRLLSFDIKTGKETGYFEFPQEIKSNPLWKAPWLMVNLYLDQREQGKLWFLEKLVKVSLSASKEPPGHLGEPVVFSAKGTGFFRAQYRFRLTRYGKLPFGWNHFILFKDKEKQIVQDWSEKTSWEWVPEKEGYYKIQVEVKDEKERAETEMNYFIEMEKPGVSLQASQEPPVWIGDEIVFQAKSIALQAPQYEFYLTPLIEMRLGWMGYVFMPQEEENLVQKKSEKNSWKWIPQEEGLYSIRVKVVGEEGKAEETIGLAVEKKEPQVELSASSKSPQELGVKVKFTAQATGFQKPVYEFYLTPLVRVTWRWGGFLFLPYRKEKQVWKSSQKNSWQWVPPEEGAYLIEVKVKEKEIQAEARSLFLIKSE